MLSEKVHYHCQQSVSCRSTDKMETQAVLVPRHTRALSPTGCGTKSW